MILPVMAVKFISTKEAAALLREAAELEAAEADIRRKRHALAKKLIETGHAMAGAASDAGGRAPRQKVAKSAKPKAAPAARRKVRERSMPWTVAVYRAIDSAQTGMTYADLKAAIRSTELAPALEATEKSFYGAVGKLVDRKMVVRHNGKLFTDRTYPVFLDAVMAGWAKDEPAEPTNGQKSPVRDLIIQYLQIHRAGVPLRELVEVANVANGGKGLDRNEKTSVYNLISRLVGRGKLAKSDDGIITIPHHGQNSEASRVGAQEASHD
jgi:hypothetical protein